MVKKFWEKIKEYNKIANIAEIGRRYFVMNSFDGILTILGILIGSYIAGINDPKVILITGFGASVAMGVSGVWGTYLTEEAERKKKLKELSRHTLRSLHKTKIGRAERAAALIIAFIDGVAPFVAALIVISPFFFASTISMQMAYYVAVAIAFVLLMLLGVFLGQISKESIFLNAVKMMIAGVICIGLVLLIGAPI